MFLLRPSFIGLISSFWHTNKYNPNLQIISESTNLTNYLLNLKHSPARNAMHNIASKDINSEYSDYVKIIQKDYHTPSCRST